MPPRAPTTQGALPVSNTDWAIGAAGGGTGRFFQGEIDDVSIWNVGLSASAVRSAMATAPIASESGLVAYYPFDETSGDTAIDATGNGNNGTLGGISPNNPSAEPSRVAGIVLSPSPTASAALSFNGTSQFVDLGNPTDLNFSGQITLDAWIMPESTGGLQDIIAHGYQTSPDQCRGLPPHQLAATTRSAPGTAITPSPRSRSRPATSANGSTWPGSITAREWILYRDGVQVATSGATTQGALPVSSTDWAIGAAGSGTSGSSRGRSPTSVIWNVGLSAASVESVMFEAPTASESGLVAYYPFNETSGNMAIDATGNGNNGTLGGISPNNPAAEPSRVAGSVLSPSVTITPGESGVETVTLQAFDAAGGSGVVTATFTASPIPIIVNAGGNAVVQQGTLLTRTCSFTDLPGDGPWTATVIYGDGTPIQPLAVNGQSFTLSHIFENAGTFTTTVTVTNRNGVSGSFSYPATVSGFTVNDGNPAAVAGQEPDLHVQQSDPDRAGRLRAAPRWQAQPHPPEDRAAAGREDLLHHVQRPRRDRRLVARRPLHADHLAQEGERPLRPADDLQRRQHVRQPLRRRARRQEGSRHDQQAVQGPDGSAQEGPGEVPGADRAASPPGPSRIGTGASGGGQPGESRGPAADLGDPPAAPAPNKRRGDVISGGRLFWS